MKLDCYSSTFEGGEAGLSARDENGKLTCFPLYNGNSDLIQTQVRQWVGAYLRGYKASTKQKR